MNLQSSLSRRLRLLVLFGLFLIAAFTVSTSGAGAEQWTNLAPSNPPPGRFAHTMVSDSANDRVIMFGGGANCGPLNDVWLLTSASGRSGPAAWIQLAPTGTGPDARYEANAVYDAASNRMIVFGGAAGGYCVGAPPLRNDVWVLTNANGLGGAPAWIQLSPIGSRPAARGASTSVYDPSSNRLIVFGGNRNIGHCFFESNDTWILTFANGLGGTPEWINATPSGGPPIARFEHQAVYDGSANEMIVYGGQHSCNGALYGDVWALVNANGVSGTPAWVSLGNAPTGQGSYTAVLDAAQHRMLTFGGGVPALTNGVRAMSNTNTTTGQLWTSLTPTGTLPSPRYSHAAVFDNARQSMIVFGGANALGIISNDTWVLSLGPAATTLTVPAASGTFGGTAILRATLSSASGPVGGMPVAFSLFGVPVGSATTAASGIATLTDVSISGRPAAAYPGVVGASFAATANNLASSATADLTVDKAPAAISVAGGGTFLYDGSGHSASGSVTGVLGESLGSASITYTDLSSLSTSSAAPFNAGSYDVSASFGGDTNYLAGANNSARITITQLSTATSLTVLTAPWLTKSSMPTARNGVAAAAINGLIYVAGGYNGSHLLTVEAYDPVSNTWTGKANRPAPQTTPAIGVINGKLYTAGGTNCCIEIGSLYEYTPATDSWAAKAPMPTTRQDATGGVVNNRLYVAGGLNSGGSGAHGTFSTLEEYDPSAGPAGTWTTKASMPTARRGAGGATAGGQFYVVGGQNASGTALNTVEAYDPGTNTWTTKAPMPTARYSVEIAQVGGLLYAIGGGVGTSYLTTVEAYDLSTNTWSTFAPLNTARVYHNTVVVNGTIYAIGGSAAGIIGATEAYAPPGPPTSSTFNQAITLTATVNTVAPGNGAAGGTVTFRSGSSVVGPANLNSSGVATFTTSSLAAGSYTFSADYGGSTNFTGSTSGPRDHAVAQADTTPPATTATPSPAANAAGWNKTNVTVALNAIDEAGGSGVQSIAYSLSGAQSGSFTTAGNSAFVSIFNEGTTTINYHAVDHGGNIEGAHALTVKVDKAAPFLSVPFNISTQASSSAGAVVTFSVSGSDGLSGLAGPATISPLGTGAIFPIGTTRETVSATDLAGNTAIGTFDVVVNPARPIINVIGGMFTADGNPHPATAIAKDSADNPVAGTFSIAYAPGGSAPVAAGRYSATASFTSSDPAFTSVFPWTTMAPDPHATWGPTIVEINGKLYALGFDRDASGNQSSFRPRLSIYDPASNTWTVGAPPSLVRAAGNAVAIDGKLYLVGGCVMSDCRIGVEGARALEIYNPITNSWSSGAPMPTGRLGAAAGVIGGKLYVTGGTTECPPCGTTSTTEIYDPTANAWTSGAPIPSTREVVAGAVVNGLLYVIGGYERGSVNANVGTVSVYDPVVNSWSTRSSMPSARQGAAVGVIHGDIYVLGGTNASGLPLAVNESYNPATDTWTEQAPMPAARYSVSGGVAYSRFYLVGGSGAHPATNEAYDPSLAALITINPGDTTPPMTNANFQSPNANGWHRFDVVVNVNANDSGGAASPSGVQSIAYTLTGAQTGGGTFNTTSTSFTIVTEGTTTVTYHATDNRGNVEADHTLVVKLDKTAPSIANLPNLTVSATSTAGATVTFDAASFDSLSGIASAGVTQGLPSGSTFPHGTTSETVRVTDLAGNFASRFFSVTVNRTLLSIAVTPSTESVNIGHDRQFQAIGHFTSGSDQTLSTGGGGGGGSTPAGSAWQLNFAPSINVSACASSSGGLDTQAISQDAAGAVNTTWGIGNVVRVTGTLTLQHVNLTLECNPANGAVGALSALWTGTRYEGTVTFGGSTSTVVITGWSTKASLPTARFSFGGAAVDGIVYAMGGGNPSQPQPVDAYNPATNSWSTVSQMLTSREGAAVAVLNGRIYVAGGHISGGAASGVFEVFDPATNSWNAQPLPSMPTARAHHAFVAAAGKLYAIGGDTGPNNSGATAVVESYDPLTNQWTARASMSTPRAFLAAGALNGGATIVATGTGSGTTELYDVAANTWTAGPAMLASGGTPAAVVVNNALFVFGIGGAGTGVHMFRPTGALPTGWAFLASMPGRGQFGVAAVGDVVYVLGGQAIGGSTQLSTVEAFSTPPPSNFIVSSGGGGGGGGSSLPTVSWQSTSPSIASISSSGFATGIASGQTTIVATAAGVSCATTSTCATLTVVDPPHVTLTLAPGSAPFASVQVTVVDPSTGQAVDGPFEVPIGEPQSLEQDQFFRLVFAAPAGYTVTPVQVDLNVHAGDDLTVPLLFALIDTTPPLLTVPGDQAAEATSAAGATVMFPAPTATDAGSGIDSVSCDRSPGDTFPLGSTIVHCSATDHADNGASASFLVTVVDTTAPSVSVPANITAEATSPAGTAATFSVSASDLVDGATSVSCNPASGSTFPLGASQVICTASDTRGNPAQRSFTIFVRDTIRPVVRVLRPSLDDLLPFAPSFVTVEVEVTDAAGLYQVSINGVIAIPSGGTPLVSRWLVNLPALPEGAVFGVSATAIDSSGNQGFATMVADNDGIEGAIDVDRYTFADQRSVYSSDFNGGGTPGTVERNGARVTVVQRGVARGVTLLNKGTARISFCSGAKYLVLDTPGEGADITCTSLSTVQVRAYTTNKVQLYKWVNEYRWVTESRCYYVSGGFLRRGYSVCYPVQVPVYYEYWYQIDLGPGQSVSTGSPVIAAADNTEPIHVTLLQVEDDGTQVPVGSFDLDAGESADVNVTQGANREDAVEFISLNGTVNVEVGGVAQVLAEGQRTTLNLDVTPPIVTVPADMTREAASSSGAVVTFAAPAADNIDGPIPVSCTPASGSTFAIGTTTVACTAIDAHGNPASGTFSVNVVDTTKPTLTLPVDLSVDATSPAGAIVTYVVSATDLASNPVTVTCAPPSGSPFQIGTSSVTCTATDAAGNIASGSFPVLVQAAAAQVDSLIATVHGFNLAQGIENSLDAKLQNVFSALNAAKSGNAGSVCGQMGAFINETTAQSGKKLTLAQANQLIARAQQIEAVIGCQ
jgi:N-acetylneuraminic acid mutarotase